MVPEIKILGQRSRRQECEQRFQKQLEEQQLGKKNGLQRNEWFLNYLRRRNGGAWLA